MVNVLLAVAVAAGGGSPGVVEIDYFAFDQCGNVFEWQTATEVNNWAYHVQGNGWQSTLVYGQHYPSPAGAVYHLPGPAHADMAGEYTVCVYFDNGTVRCEDHAVVVCNINNEAVR